jgi:hypothetical protein
VRLFVRIFSFSNEPESWNQELFTHVPGTARTSGPVDSNRGETSSRSRTVSFGSI